MKNLIRKIILKLYQIFQITARDWEDKNLILLAKQIMLTEKWSSYDSNFSLEEKEFRVYSQWGDDGIIQFLINYLDINNKYFIEFGVADFYESNTHFLLINNNWNGFVIDGSKSNIDKLKESEMYWRYNINSEVAFITKKNVNELMQLSGFSNIGLLHIDLDGNDYWIFDELDISFLSPEIIILEYNSIFGYERAITVPYKEDFYRFDEHYSGQFFGASLKALQLLANKKGYYLIGSNSAGNNAYFLKNKYKSKINEVSLSEGYVKSKFRDSRNTQGKLNYLPQQNSFKLLEKLTVYNVESSNYEEL